MGSSQSSHSHVEDGKRFAKKAEQLDHQACNTHNSELYTQAMNNYYSAVGCIRKALEHEKEAKRREILQEKMEQYLKRVELLKIWNPAGGKCGPPTMLEVVKPDKSETPKKPKDGGDKTPHAMVPEEVEKSVEKSEEKSVVKDDEVLSDDAVDATAMYVQGFELGKKASNEDRVAVAAADPMLYEIAKRTYHSAIDHFRKALLHEKVPKMIDLIEDRIQEYLERADILQAWSKSAASSAGSAGKAEGKENSKTSSRSKKAEAVAAAKAPSVREERKNRSESNKKTKSATAVSQSARSKGSSRALKQETKKTSSTKAPSSTTSKNRGGDSKDDKSSARSKQQNASTSTSTSKKGSSRSKETTKASKKSGTDSKESSPPKKTSTKRPKQTHNKMAAPKTRVKCKCGARVRRKEGTAAKK